MLTDTNGEEPKQGTAAPREHDEQRQQHIIEQVRARQRAINNLHGSSEAAAERRHTPFAV